MAILDAFEVTILTPDDFDRNVNPTRARWEVVEEYSNPHLDKSQSNDRCTRHIAAWTTVDPLLGHYVPTQFAVDFKITGGFQFADSDETEFLVFRVYHDDRKIGSGHIKCEQWERPGTFRVRKKGRRFWLEPEQKWIEEKWIFDEGLHGTIRVEIWRHKTDFAKPGTWNNPDLPTETNQFGTFIDLTNDALNLDPGRTRVRFAKRIDPNPLATFVFEYRSKDTLQSLGVVTTKEDNSAAQSNDLKASGRNYLPPTANYSNFGRAPRSLAEAVANDLPYKCDKCEDRFTEILELNEHRRSTHLVKRWDQRLETKHWWTVKYDGQPLCPAFNVVQGVNGITLPPLPDEEEQPGPGLTFPPDGSPTTASSSTNIKTPSLINDLFPGESIYPEMQEDLGTGTHHGHFSLQAGRTTQMTKKRTFSNSFDTFYEQMGVRAGVYGTDAHCIDLTMDDSD